MTLFSNSRQEDWKTVLIHMYYVCQYTNNYPAFWWKKTYPFTCICLTLPWKSHNKMASPTLISPRLSGVKATCWMWSEWPIKTYLKNWKKDFWLWFPVEVGMIQRSWNMQTFLYDESRFPSQSRIFSSSLMTRKSTKHARFQPNPKILAVCEVSFQPSGTTWKLMSSRIW